MELEMPCLSPSSARSVPPSQASPNCLQHNRRIKRSQGDDSMNKLDTRGLLCSSPCEEWELCCYLSPAPPGGGCLEQVPAGFAVGGRQREESLEPLSKSQAALSVSLQSQCCQHTARIPSASSASVLPVPLPQGKHC